MKLSRSLGLVFALCVGALSLTACASGAGDKAPSAHDGDVGTLALALTGQTNGNTYRLRNAIFDIAGPTMTTLDSESDPDGAVLATTLATGGYSITLESGWSLEKVGPMGAQTVSAALASPNPTSFMVGSGSTASVVFQFSTDGTIVEIGTGRVEVSIGVTETGATGCNILMQTGCPMGQACYFGGMDGITPICAQIVDTKPAGQPCMFQNECATPGLCGTPDGGMTVECIAACALDSMGPSCPAGLTCIDGGLGANIGACL